MCDWVDVKRNRLSTPASAGNRARAWSTSTPACGVSPDCSASRARTSRADAPASGGAPAAAAWSSWRATASAPAWSDRPASSQPCSSSASTRPTASSRPLAASVASCAAQGRGWARPSRSSSSNCSAGARWAAGAQADAEAPAAASSKPSPASTARARRRSAGAAPVAASRRFAIGRLSARPGTDLRPAANAKMPVKPPRLGARTSGTGTRWPNRRKGAIVVRRFALQREAVAGFEVLRAACAGQPHLALRDQRVHLEGMGVGGEHGVGPPSGARSPRRSRPRGTGLRTRQSWAGSPDVVGLDIVRAAHTDNHRHPGE